MLRFKKCWKDGQSHAYHVLAFNLSTLSTIPWAYYLFLYKTLSTLHCRLNYGVSWLLYRSIKKLSFAFFLNRMINSFVQIFIGLFVLWLWKICILERRIIECSVEDVYCVTFLQAFFRWLFNTLSLLICLVASIQLVDVTFFCYFILLSGFFLSSLVVRPRLIVWWSISS